jgi:hypothetical protein
MRLGRSQTGMKIEIVNTFTWDQWRSQGLQSGGGGKLSAEGANTVDGSGGMLLREKFEIQSLRNAISCILGWDYTKFRRLYYHN